MIDSDQVVMVTDGGQLIRCPVGDVSVVGRTSRGVTLFRVAEGEKIVSVTRFRDVDGNGDDAEDELDGENASSEQEVDAETGVTGSDAQETSEEGTGSKPQGEAAD